MLGLMFYFASDNQSVADEIIVRQIMSIYLSFVTALSGLQWDKFGY